jgi:Tol biopolymer transport system component
MSIPAGTRLGPYEVVSVLGAGGMGEVYRGLDTRLKRPVAIKRAKGSFTDRFLREARAVSALNHPHICTLYDVGPDYLVMELVEGETLAARLSRGPLPVDEVQRFGSQMADALAAAHGKGIVHRDLKPANVMLTRSGVKLLDFGVAKVVGPLAETAVTTQGIVGTPAYMAPEQLSGSSVDARTDIFALGLLLHEMATGKRARAGRGGTAALDAVPERLAHVIECCLAHEPEHRWQSATDVRLELEWAARNTTPSAVAPTSPPGRGLLTWGVAALVVLAAVAGALVSLRFAGTPDTMPRSTVRTTIALPPGLRLDSSVPLALSPDGTQLAFVAANDQGEHQLYIRPLGTSDAKALAGTSGAARPFFSPDGRSLGFFADGTLRRIDLEGGSPIRLCPLPGADAGGAWGGNDIIVIAIRGQGLFKVHASGGALERIGQVSGARFPSFLPDGATVLYASVSGEQGGRTVGFSTVQVDGTRQRDIVRLSDADGAGAPVLGATAEASQASLLPSGHLVFGTDPGVVRALPMDLQTLEPRGAAVTLGDPVERGANAGGVAFAVSRTGLLAFAGTGNQHELVWVTRQGVITPIQTGRDALRQPRLSPDERTIAVSINDETRTPFAWLIDVARGSRTQLAKQAINLAWSADGQRVAFGRGGLFAAPVDGSAVVTLVGVDDVAAKIAPGTAPYPTDWAADGRTLLFQADNEQIWKLSLDEHTFEQILDGPGREFEAAISPDSRAVAYTSTQSGRAEIVVATWPQLQNRRVVSTSGGATPRWSRDSKELFYWQGQTLMSTKVSPSVDVGIPVALFSGPFFGAGRSRAFDVARDGRFLMVRADARAELREITVVQDWSNDRPPSR